MPFGYNPAHMLTIAKVLKALASYQNLTKPKLVHRRIVAYDIENKKTYELDKIPENIKLNYIVILKFAYETKEAAEKFVELDKELDNIA